MKNKLKTKPKNTNRYLKGLSLAEMDDVEEAVEYALENPGGTFTAVSREHSARLSAMNKTVKSISGDTKYIRKAVDKFDKKLDDLARLVEDNSGTSSGLPVVPGPMRGSPKTRPNLKTGNRPNIKNSGPKAAGLGGMLGAALLAFSVATTIGTPTRKVDDKMLEKFWSFKGGKPEATTPVKPKNSILGRISYQQNNLIQQQAIPQKGIKELTPSERAIMIRDRLKGMTQIPSVQMGGFAPGVSQTDTSSYIPNARGSLGQQPWGPGRPSGGTTPSTTVNGADVNVKPGVGNTKGRQATMKMVYDGYRAAGFSDNQARALTAEVGRENDYNPNVLFGTHTDPHNGKKNLGMLSMQGDRGDGLYNHMAKKGLIGPDGRMIQGQASINAMAEYTKKEMETDPAYAKTKEQFLNNPNVDPEAAAGVLGRNYIRWRMDDPRYASHNNKRRDHLAEISNITRDTQFAEAKPVQNTKPGEIGSMSGPTAVVENQGTNAKVRKKPIQPELTAVLDYAAKQAGVDKVEVFSGGQAGKGEGGPRTGSTRHDHGKAGDVYLWKDGKKVNMETAEGREIMKKFATASRQAGATGIGAGRGYMGPEAMHVGFGKEATWGGADWLADAAAQGKALPPVNAMALMQEQKKASETVVASNNAPIPKSLMRNKPVPAKPISVAEKVRSDRSTEGLSERAKSYAMNEDKFPNPDRKFPERTTQTAELSATPNRDAHFAKIDAAIAAQKAAKKVALMTPAPLPLTPAETAGKGDFDRRTGQERLQADRSTDGLMERANAYAMYDDIKNPPRAFPTRQTDQPLPEHVVRPMAASVTPPPETDMLKTAQEMAQSALDKAKEAAKMITDYVKSSSDSAPPAANRIPKTSKNPPPLTNPPRSFHRATQTTNPTQKTPGSDSSKSFGTPVTDPSLYQQQDDFGAMP